MAAQEGFQSVTPSTSAEASEAESLPASRIQDQTLGPCLQMGMRRSLAPNPELCYFLMHSEAALRPSVMAASQTMPQGPLMGPPVAASHVMLQRPPMGSPLAARHMTLQRPPMGSPMAARHRLQGPPMGSPVAARHMVLRGSPMGSPVAARHMMLRGAPLSSPVAARHMMLQGTHVGSHVVASHRMLHGSHTGSPMSLSHMMLQGCPTDTPVASLSSLELPPAPPGPSQSELDPFMSELDPFTPQKVQQQMVQGRNHSAKKKKMADRTLPQKVLELVPESQTYMDLLAFERKLDQTTSRKWLDIQEALKRPVKEKRKLRIFISNTFSRPKTDCKDGEGSAASWELRVEGRLLEDAAASRYYGAKQKRKFSSFLKSLVIELDKDVYGPDRYLVEWHRTATTQEADGFQVRRPGDASVWCTIILVLDYVPPQFKLDPRLARLLGIHTQTRPVIIQALWQYVKTHALQDPHERELIVCDPYLRQIFESPRMRFAEIPERLHALLMPPEPVVIHYIIGVDANHAKKLACYDIDVEVDDALSTHMNSLLLSPAVQQDILALDSKIHDTIEAINALKAQREFMLSFASDPHAFINEWLQAQCQELQAGPDAEGTAEEERRAEFYLQPWAEEAVCRYFYSKLQQGQQELEEALGIQNP